jgi:hypothetical protein
MLRTDSRIVSSRERLGMLGDQSRADAGASQGRRHGIAIRVAPS